MCTQHTLTTPVSVTAPPPPHTVSGDDDLSGLGVSVYNQEDFEAAVLRQIDTEVQRRNADQAKAFLVKQYNNVQSELRYLLY